MQKICRKNTDFLITSGPDSKLFKSSRIALSSGIRLGPKQRKGKELAKRLSSGSVKRPPKADRALAPRKKQTEGKISTNQSAQANIFKHY